MFKICFDKVLKYFITFFEKTDLKQFHKSTLRFMGIMSFAVAKHFYEVIDQ